MMRWQLLLIAVLLTKATGAQSLKRMAADAHAAYKAEAYPTADSLYRIARTKSPSDFTLAYNAALTKYRLTQLDSAEALFNTALGLADSMQAQIQYNLGNTALMDWMMKDLALEHVSLLLNEASFSQGLSVQERLTQFLAKDSLLSVQKDLLDGKQAALELAMAHYKSALRIDPADEQARYNLLFARGKIPTSPENSKRNDPDDQKETPKNARVKALKQEAFEYIQNGKFEDAYRLLAGAQRQDPNLKGLDGLLEKLSLVLEILYGS